MKKFIIFIKIISSVFLLIFALELFTRIILFIPTNINVFKYGLKKSVSFDIVDLSKLQISIYDRDRKLNKNKNLSSKKKIWIFGGSTTKGYACEAKQSSSWPDEIFKINKNFEFKNYAFNGANTEQQMVLLLRDIVKYTPQIILWSNKFNTINVIGQSNYRNKDILKYDFSNAKKTQFFLNIKRLDKSLKSYLLFYSLIDKIILRINIKLINEGILKTIKIKPTKQDLIHATKNFEINTIEAIEVSKKFGVKEFYIISLFSVDDFEDKKQYKHELYDHTIRNIENLYYPYVKIIETEQKFKIEEKNELLCDVAHKKYKGNILQANIIYKKLMSYSNIIK